MTKKPAPMKRVERTLTMPVLLHTEESWATDARLPKLSDIAADKLAAIRRIQEGSVKRGTDNLTPDEIDAEIQAARSERKPASISKPEAIAAAGILKAFNLGKAEGAREERLACADLVRQYRAKVISTVTGREEQFGLDALADLIAARGGP